VTGLGPILACAGYAGLLWLLALSLDAIGRRSLRPRAGAAHDELAVASDVARFHGVIGGAALAVGAFLLVAYMVARRDGAALLLAPAAAACVTGAVRRVSPLWRDR
jgi:hypothetical protein